MGRREYRRGRALFERWERRRGTEWVVLTLLDAIEPVFFVSYLHTTSERRRQIKLLTLVVGLGAAALLAAFGQLLNAAAVGVVAVLFFLSFLGHDLYIAIQRWRDGGRFRRSRQNRRA